MTGKLYYKKIKTKEEFLGIMDNLFFGRYNYIKDWGHDKDCSGHDFPKNGNRIHNGLQKRKFLSEDYPIYFGLVRKYHTYKVCRGRKKEILRCPIEIFTTSIKLDSDNRISSIFCLDDVVRDTGFYIASGLYSRTFAVWQFDPSKCESKYYKEKFNNAMRNRLHNFLENKKRINDKMIIHSISELYGKLNIKS